MMSTNREKAREAARKWWNSSDPDEAIKRIVRHLADEKLVNQPSDLDKI
jgi:hypothetical protein